MSDADLTPVEKLNEADGLGACRGVRAAIPIALALWLVIALVGGLVAKWSGWM